MGFNFGKFFKAALKFIIPAILSVVQHVEDTTPEPGSGVVKLDKALKLLVPILQNLGYDPTQPEFQAQLILVINDIVKLAKIGGQIAGSAPAFPNPDSIPALLAE